MSHSRPNLTPDVINDIVLRFCDLIHKSMWPVNFADMNIINTLGYFITTNWSKIYEPSTYGEFRKTEQARDQIKETAYAIVSFCYREDIDDFVFWMKCRSYEPLVAEDPVYISGILLAENVITVEVGGEDVSTITPRLVRFIQGLARGEYDHCDFQSALFAKLSVVKTLKKLMIDFPKLRRDNLIITLFDLGINLLD